jgi:glycosyltransferase involved in cell wall biosynthesis
LKVLLVSPSYYPIVGGTETFVRQLATKLNAFGVQADVMTFNMNRKWKPSWKNTSERNDFTVFRVGAFASPFSFLPIDPINLLLRVNVIPRLGFAKILNNYDVIHFCDEEDLSFPFFSVLSKKPKIMHSLTPMAFEAIRRNFFQRTVFRQIANMFIPCSFQISSYLNMGIPQSEILDKKSVGVNADVFRPDESKRLDSLVLFVGRLQKLKGVHILLQALLQLNTPVHAVIIGPFDPSTPEYSEELKKMVELINAKGTHNVELLGNKTEKELVPWYQKATFLVAPHLDRICGGLTTLEALACSTPIIATGDEVIKDGVNGLLIPPNDAEKLASALRKLLEDKKLRKKYGSEGRRIIEEQYSWDKIVKDLIPVYKKTLNNCNARYAKYA